MARQLLPDHLWEIFRLFLPAHPPHPKGGRPFLDDRRALTGIIFVLKTGIPWEYLPAEMGCGSGMTCWRRLRMWTIAGVWTRVQQFLLDHLRFLDKIDFKRFLIDSSHLRARGAGAKTGPSPVDRRKPGSKIHILTDGTGVPIQIHLTAGNRNDVEETIPLIDDVPPIAGHVGGPRCRPDRLQGDRGYDDEGDRAKLRQRHIAPIIPKRGSAHGSGLGTFRWFIERTISWLRQFPRVRVRTDRDPTNYVGWLALATIFICHRIAFPRLC